MLNQYEVEIPTLPVDQYHSHLTRYLKGCWGILSHRRAAKKGRQAFGTHMVYRETFFCRSFSIFISSLSSRIASMEVVRRAAPFVHNGEKWKAITKSRFEMPVRTVSQRFSHLQWRRLFKELLSRPTTTADFGPSLWQVPHTSYLCLLEDKVQDRGSTCSQFPTEAMQWIKEVELVDSVDESRSSSSNRGISMPNFEELDARIASALNKIIHNSHFKRKISLEEQKAQKQDRFLRGRQIAYLIYDYFWVTGSHDSVENFTDLFTIRVPSPTLSRHRTRTLMTWHSASCSQRHTEDKPITANQKACQSVSRRCLLCSIEQGNLREKEMSISQLVLVSRETRTVHTASFLKTPKLRKWSIDQGNLRSETAQMHRLGP